MPLPAAVIVLLMLPAQGGGGAAIDLNTYVAELERAKGIVEAAATLEQGRSSASDLPDRWTVQIDRETVSVDAQWIRRELQAANAQTWPAVRERLVRRLTGLQMEAADSAFAHARDPRAVVAATLARPEFQDMAASRWLDQQRARVAKWLLGVFDRVLGRSMPSGTLALTFAWLAAAVALVVLSIWLWRTLTRRSQPTVLDLDGAAPPVAREWALRALAAARAGDFGEAVRCGYHAALCQLQEQGLWWLDQARTPREYLRLLARDDPRYPTLDALTRQFERISYGGKPATRDDARQLTAHLEKLGCVRATERAI